MTSNEVTPSKSQKKLLGKLQGMGINVHLCYQCGRCSAGCPIADFSDLGTMEMVRLAAYGMEETLLNSKAIWLCTACETCATRCPNGINISMMVDLLRELAQRKHTEPAEKQVPLFHHAFLSSVNRWGRAYEIGLLAGYKVRSGDLKRDLQLGLKMFAKGRLSLLPHPIRKKAEVRELFTGKGTEYER